MTSFNTSEFIERGEKLHADISDFAQRLSLASRTAIGATNPALAGTELGDEWPLSFDLTIMHRLAEMATPTTRSIGRVAVGGEQIEPPRPEMFIEEKIRSDALEEAYGSDAPHQAFALDLLGWTNRMEEAGWSLLVRMDVSARGRIELAFYEDNDTTRAYFNSLTDVNSLTKVDIAEGTQPYAYLGERVVVDDSNFALEVLTAAAQK